MPRRRRPEGPTQLSLDLYRPAEPTPEGATQQALLANLAGEQRFVQRINEDVTIRAPVDAARFLQENVFVPIDQFEQEELWVLLLNTRNKVTHAVMVYRGMVDSIQARIAEIMREAVRHNAKSIVVSHCHPSGDPSPSPEDVAVTRKLVEAGSLLNIEVLDHVVIGSKGWVSLKERGLGF